VRGTAPRFLPQFATLIKEIKKDEARRALIKINFIESIQRAARLAGASVGAMRAHPSAP
jgi:hypothetical protein